MFRSLCAGWWCPSSYYRECVFCWAIQTWMAGFSPFTLAALMPSPEFCLERATNLLTLDGHLLLCHCLSFHLNALEAPNPKGASGREWCYVEPQVELSLLLARPWAWMMLGGWPAWRGRLGILWWVADLDRRLVRSTAFLWLPAPGWLP